MRIIVVGGDTVGTNSFDQVEIYQTSANTVNILLVEATNNWWRKNWLGRSDITKSAFTLDKVISSCTDAGSSGKVVGGIGRANIAVTSDEEISNCANTSIILVDLIYSTYRYNF